VWFGLGIKAGKEKGKERNGMEKTPKYIIHVPTKKIRHQKSKM